MTDWPKQAEKWGIGTWAIGVHHQLSLGTGLKMVLSAVQSSTAWPAANRAIFVPFRLPRQVTVCQMGCGTTATAGNFDLGVYDRWGNRLVSTGATAKSEAENTEAIVNVTDTVIGPGLYFMAMASDGVTAFTAKVPTLAGGRVIGMREMASAYPLPATATFAATTGDGYVPSMSVWLKAV